MSHRPVALLDSGIGGLPYLSWIQKNMPHESLIYLADRKNFPYGEKSPERIIETVLGAVEILKERFDIKALVLACNTASVTALDSLRQRFSFPVVGVVPAVKTGIEMSKTGRIGVLATQRTIDDPYLQSLISQFGGHSQVVCLAAGDIVRYVEEDYLSENPSRREAILGAWAQTLKNHQVDVVVLGCTHFIHVNADLQRALGKEIQIIDSREGVGRRLQWVLEQQNLLSRSKTQPDQLYFTHGDSATESLSDLETKYRVFAQRFNLEFKGVLSP